MSARVLLLLAATVCFALVAFGVGEVKGVNLLGAGSAFFTGAFLEGSF